MRTHQQSAIGREFVRITGAGFEISPLRASFGAHFHPMSQHRSLRGASTIVAKRNVLKRFERVELLKKRGQWKEGRKVIGLPKTKPDA
jgi:small basic protein (TIGR04137 family)